LQNPCRFPLPRPTPSPLPHKTSFDRSGYFSGISGGLGTEEDEEEEDEEEEDEEEEEEEVVVVAGGAGAGAGAGVLAGSGESIGGGGRNWRVAKKQSVTRAFPALVDGFFSSAKELGEFIRILALCLVLLFKNKKGKETQHDQHTQFVNGIWVVLDMVEQLGFCL